MLVTKTAKAGTIISKLSPTHFVSNIRHQHRCSPSANQRRENPLSNLPRHMMEIHGISITRDQIYEFDYVLRRFNQLKEEIFGVDYITDLMDSESEVKYLNLIG